jgi:hypothetical protein
MHVSDHLINELTFAELSRARFTFTAMSSAVARTAVTRSGECVHPAGQHCAVGRIVTRSRRWLFQAESLTHADWESLWKQSATHTSCSSRREEEKPRKQEKLSARSRASDATQGKQRKAGAKEKKQAQKHSE